MNTTTPTHSLRVRVAGRTGYIGPNMIKYPLHRGCDVATFDNLSASRHGPMRKDEYMLPGNLAVRMDPVTSPSHLSAYNKHRAADGKATFT